MSVAVFSKKEHTAEESAAVLESSCHCGSSHGSSLSHPPYGVEGQLYSRLPHPIWKGKESLLLIFGFMVRTMIFTRWLKSLQYLKKEMAVTSSPDGIVLPGCWEAGCRLSGEEVSGNISSVQLVGIARCNLDHYSQVFLDFWAKHICIFIA